MNQSGKVQSWWLPPILLVRNHVALEISPSQFSSSLGIRLADYVRKNLLLSPQRAERNHIKVKPWADSQASRGLVGLCCPSGEHCGDR